MKHNQTQYEFYSLLLEYYIQDLENEIHKYTFDKKIHDLLKEYKPPEEKKYSPPKDFFDPTSDVWGVCPMCGLKLNQVMGYCCPNQRCPTGLGPITS